MWNKTTFVLPVAGILLLCACTGMEPTMENVAELAFDKDNTNAGLGFAETMSFDVATENNRVHVLAAGKLTNSDQLLLRYVHSDDGGQHWSKPTDVRYAKPPTQSVRGNDIQLAVAGKRLFALWQTTGEMPGMGPMVSAYSQDGGKTWQGGANPAANDAGDQSHFDVAATGDGAVHVVWLDDRNENGYQGLRYGRSDDLGAHWQASITLDDTTCSCCWNKIALLPNGAINVLYRDMEVRDMNLVQSQDNGATWQKPNRVGDFGWKFEGCPHVGGGLASAGAGVLHSVVWTGADQKQGLYYLRSADNGKLWTAPHKLGNKALHGDIAVQDDQRVRAVWDETGAEGGAVYSALSVDGGATWAQTIQWSVANHNALHPRVVPTQKGFLLLWTEKYGKRPSQLVTVFVE